MRGTRGLLAVVLGAFLLSALVLAAGTPAGTQIKNQATATYADQNGVSQTAASNEVITEVSQVCGITIVPNGTEGSPGQSQEAAPGNTVYFSYTLTNTGNGPDTYKLQLVNSSSDDFDPSSGSVYLDANGNGLVDPGEAELTSGFGSYGSATGTVAADGQIKLIVAYNIPATATDAQVTKVNLVGQSQACADNPTDGDAGDATDNWNQTTVTEDANVTATKSVTPSSVDPGDTIIYTITGSNTGNKAAKSVVVTYDSTNYTGILITDEIPDHTTLKSGSYSGAPATGYALFSTDNGSTWSATAASMDSVTDIAWFIPDPNPSDTNKEDTLDPGQGYSFTFQVTINADAPAGIIPNTAVVNWADSTDTDKTTETNQADVTVNGNYAVFIGPDGTPEATGLTDQNDDVTNAGTRAAGTWVSFTNTAKNAGNVADTINITVESHPTNWQVLLYKSDGITPLADTNSDGIPDVGELAVDGTADIVVKVFIPYDETADSNGATTVHDTVIRATSSTDPTAYNETIDRVTDITAAGVDLSNNPYNESSVTKLSDPGACVDFPLLVINTGGAPDTYDLSVSSTLLTDWTATFYADQDLDESADDTNPISSVGTLGGAVLISAASSSDTLSVSSTDYFATGDTVRIGTTNYTIDAVDTTASTITIDTSITADEGTVVGEVGGAVAHVCVPAGQAPGDTDVTFEATSNNDPTKADTITDQITVNQVAGVSLNPDRSGTGSPGGTVVYEHTLCNTGNVTDTFDLSYASDWGWTYTFTYAEDYGSYSAGNPITDTNSDGNPDVPTLGPGDCVSINVTAFIPSDAAVDQLDVVTITATGETYAATDTAQDVTRVVQGLLKLEKSVDPTGEQEPGTSLTYTTAYKNLGSAPITNVVIYDAIPAYTTYVNSSAGGTIPAGQILYSYSTDGGSTWSAWLSTSPTGASISNLRWGLDIDGDDDVDEDDALASGESGTVTFQVTIND
jgi:trimeric autotransporter adhesin